MLGDFNIDLLKSAQNSISKILMEKGMFNCLSSTQVTTNANTQIDWAFSNINLSDLKADIYETVHSFHNPIYIRIKRHVNSPLLQNVREESSMVIDGEEEAHGNEIMDVDEIPDDTYPIRSNAEIQIDHLNQVQIQILIPYTCLSNHTLDLLLDIIKKNSALYKPLNIFKIQPVPKLLDDVHIFYEEPEQSGKIGHWIRVNYVYKENKLYVYDSLMQNRLKPKQLADARILYPLLNEKTGRIEFPKLQHRQTNSSSCGVFAAAYAVSVVLGKNPSTEQYQINNAYKEDESMLLRTHLWKIIQEERLFAFPVSRS